MRKWRMGCESLECKLRKFKNWVRKGGEKVVWESGKKK